MLAMIINSLKNSIGKNLIKPTYPGRQDTQHIPQVKILYFIYGIKFIGLMFIQIIGTII